MLDFSLDIIGNEWMIIAFVAIILFLGTKRLPDVSRKIGKIMVEYNKTKNMVQNELQKATTSYNISVQGPVETERQKLETIAKSLGIDYINKTDDELKNMIASKIGNQPSTNGTDNQAS
ncbi:MAG TPA: twin-arginine translocase TatA/TatE family subunit [Nitrosopumilaceae archaeon]|nr:twin-arginine translocase TatA/TatE family subunit [Nitrosopumilaceae archaeon]